MEMSVVITNIQCWWLTWWSFGFDGEIIDNQPGLRADGRRWRISGGKVWKRAGIGFRRRRWTIVETQWRQHIQIQNIRWRWSFSWIQQAVINEFPGPGQKEGQGCQTGLQVHRQKEKRQILIKDQDCRVFLWLKGIFVTSCQPSFPFQSRFIQIFSPPSFRDDRSSVTREQRDDWSVGKWRTESVELTHALFCETRVAYLG